MSDVEKNNLDFKKKIRVFIVDDSPMMCKVMKSIISEDPELEVAGIAMSGQIALDALSKTPCDVCTLDVNMPGMNGMTLLKHIMIKFPKPCLMVSAFTTEGSDITFTSLKYGAVDFYQKPSNQEGEGIEEQKKILLEKIKRASQVKVAAARYLRLQAAKKLEEKSDNNKKITGITVLGTSTGGYSSILTLIPLLANPPHNPVIAVMGTPSLYLGAFVDYLNTFSSIPVKRMQDNDILKNGMIHFISADETPSLEIENNNLILRLSPRKKSFTAEGAIDLLLFACSDHYPGNTQAVFLSGDGNDGVNGCKEVLRTGGKVFVQEIDTCLASENPLMIASQTGAEVIPIDKISQKTMEW